jgi:predicted metal-dependent HD superfamily phosphohydrolase
MPTDPSTSSGDDDLLDRFEATLPNQRELGERLLARYREPHRAYHNVDHLRHVLTMIDELATDQDLFLVRLAAWFHDAVYDIPERELTNEEASARLSIRELSRAGFEQEDMTQVARLVRLTATHVPGARDPEGELLCDADLAILAAEPAAYERYLEQVRAEYSGVPDEQFLAGRLAILVELAQRPLFRTGKGQSLTAAAQRNLNREIATISERLGVPVEGSEA